MQASAGTLTLPSVNTVGTVTVTIHAGAEGRTLKLQKNVNGAGWTDVTTWTGIGVTGATFTYDVNDPSANIALRLATPSAAVYVHDIIVTDYNSEDPNLVIPLSLTFGTIVPGATVTQVLTLANSGASNTLHLTSLSPASGDTGKFSVGAVPATLAPAIWDLRLCLREATTGDIVLTGTAGGNIFNVGIRYRTWRKIAAIPRPLRRLGARAYPLWGWKSNSRAARATVDAGVAARLSFLPNVGQLAGDAQLLRQRAVLLGFRNLHGERDQANAPPDGVVVALVTVPGVGDGSPTNRLNSPGPWMPQQANREGSSPAATRRRACSISSFRQVE